MQVLIRAKGFSMTSAIEDHIRNRTRFILSRFADVISRIQVFVADQNGPKGGIDKSCIVKIKTTQGSELVIRDIEDDLYIAIARALARTKQSLSRHLQRARAFNRRVKAESLEGSLGNGLEDKAIQ